MILQVAVSKPERTAPATDRGLQARRQVATETGNAVR